MGFLRLQKGDHLIKPLNNYIYLGIEDLPQVVFIESVSINVDFLNDRTGEITAGAYLVFNAEIVSDWRLIGTG